MRFGYTAGCVGDNVSVLCENHARVFASCYWQGEIAASATHDLSGTLAKYRFWFFRTKTTVSISFPIPVWKTFDRFHYRFSSSVLKYFWELLPPHCIIPRGSDQIRFTTANHSQRIGEVKAFFIYVKKRVQQNFKKIKIKNTSLPDTNIGTQSPHQLIILNLTSTRRSIFVSRHPV